MQTETPRTARSPPSLLPSAAEAPFPLSEALPRAPQPSPRACKDSPGPVRGIFGAAAMVCLGFYRRGFAAGRPSGGQGSRAAAHLQATGAPVPEAAEATTPTTTYVFYLWPFT